MDPRDEKLKKVAQQIKVNEGTPGMNPFGNPGVNIIQPRTDRDVPWNNGMPAQNEQTMGGNFITDYTKTQQQEAAANRDPELLYKLAGWGKPEELKAYLQQDPEAAELMLQMLQSSTRGKSMQNNGVDLRERQNIFMALLGRDTY